MRMHRFWPTLPYPTQLHPATPYIILAYPIAPLSTPLPYANLSYC